MWCDLNAMLVVHFLFSSNSHPGNETRVLIIIRTGIIFTRCWLAREGFIRLGSGRSAVILTAWLFRVVTDFKILSIPSECMCAHIHVYIYILYICVYIYIVHRYYTCDGLGTVPCFWAVCGQQSGVFDSLPNKVGLWWMHGGRSTDRVFHYALK